MFQAPFFRPAAIGCALVCGALMAACDGSDAAVAPEEAMFAHDHSGNSPAMENRQLAELRRATAKFHNFEAAQAAGYTILFDPDGAGPGSACLSNPALGAMGEHYVDPALLFDGGALDISQPEALIYEPMQNGKFRLVAVEYVIPFSDLPMTSEPPVLFGQKFMPNNNPGFQLWALHAWVWKNNPSGMFAAWNPNVTCEFSAN